MLFNTHLCNHILLQKWWWDLGHRSVHCYRCGFWESGCRRLARKRMYAEDRGLQVPMALEHRPVTSRGKPAPGPDLRIRHRIQIGMFRPIRVDHTDCLQVAIKTHSFNRKMLCGSKEGEVDGHEGQREGQVLKNRICCHRDNTGCHNLHLETTRKRLSCYLYDQVRCVFRHP
jgi:hypothetical protein